MASVSSAVGIFKPVTGTEADEEQKWEERR
jgi:hypothetical protein